jgi:hypothetical protein
MRPCGTFDFPWDLGLVAHKSSDIDPVLGPVPLTVDVRVNPGACDYAFPLRYFTDADVWEYHRRFRVPVNKKRYNVNNGYQEHHDITYNNDYHYACTLCMDTDSPPMVLCPKYGYEVPNISSQLHYIENGVPDYIAH